MFRFANLLRGLTVFLVFLSSVFRQQALKIRTMKFTPKYNFFRIKHQ